MYGYWCHEYQNKTLHLMDVSYTLVDSHRSLPANRNREIIERFEDVASNFRRCRAAILLHADWLLVRRLRADLTHVLEVVGIHFLERLDSIRVLALASGVASCLFARNRCRRAQCSTPYNVFHSPSLRLCSQSIIHCHTRSVQALS